MTRLAVTRLEGRDNPSPTLNVTNFSGQQVGGSWVVTGQISDANPSQDTVAIGGDVSGSARVYADGSFDFVTTRSGIGTVTAQATDPTGNHSIWVVSTVNVPLIDATPHLTLNVEYGQQRSVRLFGKVSDDDSLSGLTVAFSGKVTGSTTTDSNGQFSFTANASALGYVYASTTNRDGLPSNVPVIQLTSAKPTITLVATPLGGGMWQLSGHVTDESPVGLTVTISGLANTTATVDANGNFSVDVTIPPNQHGTISAQTIDWWGQDSNFADCTI